MGLDMYLYCNSRPLTKEIHEDEPYGDYITELYESCGVVLYWRKANQIHKWFVDHVQNGVDDCGEYDVSWSQLVELRDTCERILSECPLVDGIVENGSTYKDGKWADNLEDGKVMTNVELAERLLPTRDGFFFGGTDYEQWYYEDVMWTAEQLTKIIDALVDGEHILAGSVVHPDEPDWRVKFRYSSSW